MSSTPCSQRDLAALDELIEERLHILFEILTRPHSLEELSKEVNRLNDLLSSFSRRNELIQMLQDSFTPDRRRKQIREMLKAQRIEIAETKEEMDHLRNKSNHLIKRAVSLIAKAQRKIDKQSYKHSGYAIETCGLCKGLRSTREGLCQACRGEGSVLVRQPAQKCMRCRGNGLETNGSGTISRVCVICFGTGWLLTSNRI